MTHVVTDLRRAVFDALSQQVPDVTWTRAHWDSVAASELPLASVSTPIVATARLDHEQVARTVDVVVMLKRAIASDDAEDRLDADAAEIEPLVLGVLRQFTDHYDLVETQTKIDGAPKVAIAELTLLFRAVLRTDESSPE